jgi:hypothetical protein
MGWTFYDLASLPEVYDIVWCKWPQREDKTMPGPIVRLCLCAKLGSCKTLTQETNMELC